MGVALTSTPVSANPLAFNRDNVELRFLLGGDIEYEDNFDLDDSRASDVTDYETTFRTSLTYRPTDRVTGYLETELKFNVEHEEGDGSVEDASLDITHAYVAIDDVLVSDLRFVVGRFLKRDNREWLFDENLDGFRMIYEPDGAEIEFLLARVNIVQRDLFDADSTGEAITNAALLADFEVSDDLWVGGYGVLRDDGTEGGDEGRPIHFGLRTHGLLGDNLLHWFDIGAVRGNDGEAPLKGHAITFGGTYTFEDLPAAPRLTLGYARASGDSDSGDGRNRAFRQTGLQSNEGEFGDSAKFKYYGEAFDPELSNIEIMTVGLGINPTDRLSVDLIYNRYRQVVATDGMRDAAVDPDPNEAGLPFSNGLGQALDLVVGYEPADDWEIELAAGYFWPGDAYRSESGNRADPALFARLGVEYRF